MLTRECYVSVTCGYRGMRDEYCGSLSVAQVSVTLFNKYQYHLFIREI